MGICRWTSRKCTNRKTHVRGIHVGILIRFSATTVFFILTTLTAFALDRDRTLAQFHHTAWTAKEGVPGGIRAITQTKDGYLWLGSSNGLYRFDGVRFDEYQPRSGGEYLSKDIFSLLVTPDNGIWIGYWFGGASFLKDGNLTNYGETEGLPSGRLPSFARDDDGTVWFAAANGLARLDGSRWERIGAEWNYPGKSAQSIYFDRGGTLWVATDDTIVFLPKGSRLFQSTGERVRQVLKIIQSPDGSMWMSETMRSVRQIQVPGFNRELSGPEIRVGSKEILFDRGGSLWVTSLGDGIRRVPYPERLRGQTITKPKTATDSFTEKEGLSGDFVLQGQAITKLSSNNDTFTEKQGLSGDFVFTAFEDREGNMWIGTGSGLDRFRENDLVPVRFPAGEQNFGLAAGNGGEVWIVSHDVWRLKKGESMPVSVGGASFSALFMEDMHTLWVGGAAGSLRIRVNEDRGNRFAEIPRPPVPKSVPVSTIFKDRQNVFWFYFGQEGIFQLSDGIWSRYERQSELPELTPITGAIDSQDRKWFGYTKNTLTVIEGDNIRTFSRGDGLDVGDVKAIQEGHGNIWVGGTTGLALLNGDRFHMVLGGASGGFSGISGVVTAKDGSVWLNESRGIIHIPTDEVRSAIADPMHKIQFRIFDYLDGLSGTAQQGSPFPTAIEGTDGRLWFSTSKGIVWIEPSRIAKNPNFPPVSIRSVTTDEKTYEPLTSLQLPKGTTRLQIDFTALSLTIPERVRFRYRLDGVDEHWQEPGTKREATYTNLGPGSYHFQVIAANNDGVWNEQGTSYDFEILPMFYQTNWFLVICAGAFGVFGLAAYQWRLYNVKSRLQHQFDERLSERTRIAQDLHDTLLQGVVSAAMQLDVATERVGEKSPAKPMLDHINGLMTDVIAEGRNALKGLRSPTINYLSDLEQRLSEVRQEVDIEKKIDFRTMVTGQPRPLLSAVGEETHQICREALTNAFRHSGGTLIEVELEYTRKLFRIVVRDNGRGIDPNITRSGRDGHFGLSGMHERANSIGAQLKVYSRTEGGTEVELSVPGRLAFETHYSNIAFRWFNSRNHRKPESRKEAADQ